MTVVEENSKDNCNMGRRITIMVRDPTHPNRLKKRNVRLLCVISVNLFGPSHDEVGFPFRHVQRISAVRIIEETARFPQRTHIVSTWKPNRKCVHRYIE